MTSGDRNAVHQAAARAQAEVARAIASSRDLESVLDLVVDRARELRYDWRLANERNSRDEGKSSARRHQAR
ncbi:MAG TPA: hypothetical protein VJO34_17340 [Methylomirabilota bacterium]|nr:hypothetical protein [Methylomirabilota bacterium]